MKKIIRTAACILACVFLLCGCNSATSNESNNQTGSVFSSNNSSSQVETSSISKTNEAEDAALIVISTIKSVLKNPDSMIIHSITYCDKESSKSMIDHALEDYEIIYRSIKDYLDFTYLFKIDFSAQNGFGGMNRETYYISYKSAFVSKYQMGEEEQSAFQNLADFYLSFPYSINVNKLGL